VNQYILSHLHDDLSLVRLAEVVFLSPTYLSKLYKQASGIGLSNYINEARITRAMELLKDNRYKIHEIAGMVGMESPTYFTRFFKRTTNMSPQEYRDSIGKQ
ncbi:MAG: response regulator, partial [Paenibacillus sp.]|nr:response regulator [Paenibacillus sp.]